MAAATSASFERLAVPATRKRALAAHAAQPGAPCAALELLCDRVDVMIDFKANTTRTQSTDFPLLVVPGSAFVCRLMLRGTTVSFCNALKSLDLLVGAIGIEPMTPPV